MAKLHISGLKIEVEVGQSRIEVANLPPVKQFLGAITTSNTKKAYLTALVHFSNVLSPDTVETILQSIGAGKKNVYVVLDSYVQYLRNKGLFGSLQLNVAAAKSYLGYYGIDIVSTRFKKRVKLPKQRKEKPQAIDASDIRKILLKCNNRRLVAYILLLASGGMREIEAAAIRIKDIDSTVIPTKIHISAKYAKTGIARDIYISDEATKYLKDLIEWKYRDNRLKKKNKTTDDLVFAVGSVNPQNMYIDLARAFALVLDSAGFAQRDENNKLHRVTFRSLRRFVDSTITDSAGKDYAEWFLGHKNNPYYNQKEPKLREMYASKCMKHLTFLSYDIPETSDTDAELQAKGMEIQTLRNEQHQIRDELTQSTQAQQQLLEQLKSLQQTVESYKQDVRENETKRIKEEYEEYRQKKQEWETPEYKEYEDKINKTYNNNLSDAKIKASFKNPANHKDFGELIRETLDNSSDLQKERIIGGLVAIRNEIGETLKKDTLRKVVHQSTKSSNVSDTMST
jgi:integrase